MKISQAHWTEIRRRFLEGAAGRGVDLTLRDRVWAVTPAGRWIALPGTSDSPVVDKWWLGCDPEKLSTRDPLGIILLCQAREGSLHAICLPEATFREVEHKLSRNPKQVFFNVIRRRGRFLLQLRGGEELDVTERVDDLSWVAAGREAIVAEGMRSSYPGATLDESVGERDTTRTPDVGGSTTAHFFAVVRSGNLHPLDDVTLEPGAFYLVEARPAQTVPGTRSLRRILARGGPTDLPADFAEQHDHYAHGAARR